MWIQRTNTKHLFQRIARDFWNISYLGNILMEMQMTRIDAVCKGCQWYVVKERRYPAHCLFVGVATIKGKYQARMKVMPLCPRFLEQLVVSSKKDEDEDK